MGESGTLPGETLGLQDMEDSFRATRPYCGETVELLLESDVKGARLAATLGRSKSEPKEAIAVYRWDARMGRNN
jgi:hypothetical protein